jgi:hypothetical protein
MSDRPGVAFLALFASQQTGSESQTRLTYPQERHSFIAVSVQPAHEEWPTRRNYHAYSFL